jgi:hypothetical protein
VGKATVSEREVKRWTSTDGKKAAVIVERADGLFEIIEYRELSHDEHPYWTHTYRSGLYGSFEIAEREAPTELPWLRLLPSG